MSKQLAVSSALSVLLMAGFALSDGRLATVPLPADLPATGSVEMSAPSIVFGPLG